MKQGELLVARLGKGATAVRFLEAADDKITVALGRNKQARIPRDRIVLETGLVVSSEEEVEEFRRKVEDAASGIDVAEIWDVIVDDQTPAPVAELAELSWGVGADAAHHAAMAVQLDRSNDYFLYRSGRYEPRSRDAVAEILERRRREAEHAEQAATLMGELILGHTVSAPTEHQESLLRLLRDYAVHGEEHRQVKAAKELLATVFDTSGDLQRRCFELLVAAGLFSADEPLEVHRARIRAAFPKDALAEAEETDVDALVRDETRRDLTGTGSFTIDDETTEDRDDAISIEERDEGAVVGIHIADAGALIPAGGAVDREADRRMATLYVPDGNVAMLPSTAVRAGSLDPGETRAALSMTARVSGSGEVTDWAVAPSIVRSDGALSYARGDRALEDADDERHRTLSGLARVASALRRRREDAGAVLVDRAELVVRVVDSGRVEVSVRRSTPAAEVVAELMILCNSLLADFCRKERLPAVYRSQQPADLGDLAVQTEMPLQLRRYLTMRRLVPADLDLTPAPHAGLGLAAYIQATSPLRRYPDLVMQRQISHYLSSGKALYTEEEMASVAQRAAVQLRELAGIEEQRKRYWFLKYLEQSLTEGEDGLFEAVVLENEPRRPALLELAEYPFRIRAEVPSPHGPGQTVTLRLHGVDLWRRVGQWVHVTE